MYNCKIEFRYIAEKGLEISKKETEKAKQNSIHIKINGEQKVTKDAEKAKSYIKPIYELEFEHEYKCDECEKQFETEVGFENHIMRKCFLCDSCIPCNCAEEF